jgi:hypothetical protein
MQGVVAVVLLEAQLVLVVLVAVVLAQALRLQQLLELLTLEAAAGAEVIPRRVLVQAAQAAPVS